MASTTFGPLLGPVISGYMSVYSWRWSFWVGLIIAGVTWVPLAFIPESYEPVLLLRKAKKMRKATGDMNIVAPRELEEFTISDIVTKVLARPLKMIVTEPLVAFSCLYLSFVYALFYIFFQAYPIIYKGTYGFTNGEEGLAFLPIGVGASIACAIYLVYDAILRRAKAADAPWSRSEEFRRLPLACFGGPFIVISLFWAGWTARPDIHWIVPVLSGITFGVGYLLIFMALLNYLTDAYTLYAASAMAVASTSRSLFGAVLPFAARPMYQNLGIAWACSLLGFIAVVMCAIPFVFIKFGDRIRSKSKFCQELRMIFEKEQERIERERRRAERKEGNDSSGHGNVIGRKDVEKGA